MDFDLTVNRFNLGICKFDEDMRDILYTNPHCIEYFCRMDNCKNCTKCYKKLKDKFNSYYMREAKRILNTSDKEKNILMQTYDNSYCSETCSKGYIYGFRKLTNEDINLVGHNIDKYKGKKEDFKKLNIIDNVYNINNPNVNFELTLPKPTSVIYWGQLKLFLETLFFLTKTINSNENIHIIYAGSAPGYSINKLTTMFSNTKWYLIDPREQAKELYTNKNVTIMNQFFTNETAEYFYNLLPRNEKILFMSDIRLGTSDQNIVEDNKMQAEWHKIIKPDWSYLKFRFPYNMEKKMEYFEGNYYFQAYAPISSTETRVLVERDAKYTMYDTDEYQSRCFYHNRILRPSYYEHNIEHNYIDHCFDCTLFINIIKDYNNKFPKFFNTSSISTIITKICDTFFEGIPNKIKIMTLSHRANLIK